MYVGPEPVLDTFFCYV